MKKLLLIFALIFLLSVPAAAIDTDAVEQALPDAAREILGDITVGDITGSEGILERILNWITEQLGEQFSKAAHSACIALAVTLLCSVAGALSADGKTPGFMLLGGALAIMLSCAGEIQSFLAQIETALAEMSDFSKALLPCIAASATATGHGAAGAARYAASALFLDVLMTVGTRVVLPLIYAYTAASTANAALPSGVLGGPARLIGWVCNTLLTGLTTVFTLCLSLSGVIAANADKIAGSLAKTAISAALPVVGSILSDAAETYLAGAELIRGAVGIFGLVAVLCVCVGPFLSLGLHYLLYKLVACVSEPFSEGRLSALLGNVATAYGMALGLLGSAGAMLFISIALGTEVFAA